MPSLQFPLLGFAHKDAPLHCKWTELPIVCLCSCSCSSYHELILPRGGINALFFSSFFSHVTRFLYSYANLIESLDLQIICIQNMYSFSLSLSMLSFTLYLHIMLYMYISIKIYMFFYIDEKIYPFLSINVYGGTISIVSRNMFLFFHFSLENSES